MTAPPIPDHVRRVFDAAPAEARAGMLALRALVYNVAATTRRAGPITEDLRWGQPAYLAPKGSTLRLGIPKARGTFALFAHCQTTLIADFNAMTAGSFMLEGNRAVLFNDVAEIDKVALAPLIARALTWHLNGGRNG